MLKTLKKNCKFLYAESLNRLGILSAQNTPFIIVYHRVLSEDTVNYVELPGMYVSEETFRLHAQILKNGFHVIPLNDLLSRFFKGHKMNKFCAITFDDGWKDNYTNAFPIIKDYKIPVSIFLPTAFVDTNKFFWPEEVCYFLFNSFRAISIERYFNNKEVDLLKKFNFEKKNNGDIITHLIDTIKSLGNEERTSFVEKITLLNIKNTGKVSEMLNWDEIASMKNSCLVDFYSHSHNHYFLPELTPEKIDYEISHSIELIKSNIINQETDIFCYPSGRYNDTVIDILKKNHVEYALDRHGGCLKGTIDKYRVPRIPLHDDISYSEALFRLQLSKS